MSQRASQRVSSRPARRHERRDGHDIADIYEARLLAQGLRSDDFVILRSSTNAPHVPDIAPIPFGRGVERSILQPIAVATDHAEPAETPEPDETGETSVQMSDNTK
jgi:hypothetical protein